MRILGFSKKWDKLSQPEFTTFRYPRADTDWFVGEQVQIVFLPRRKGGGEKLGIALIIKREQRELDVEFAEALKVPFITEAEAIADGFESRADMVKFMERTYGRLDYISLMNKLTLKWISREPRTT